MADEVWTWETNGECQTCGRDAPVGYWGQCQICWNESNKPRTGADGMTHESDDRELHTMLGVIDGERLTIVGRYRTISVRREFDTVNGKTFQAQVDTTRDAPHGLAEALVRTALSIRGQITEELAAIHGHLEATRIDIKRANAATRGG